MRKNYVATITSDEEYLVAKYNTKYRPEYIGALYSQSQLFDVAEPRKEDATILNISNGDVWVKAIHDVIREGHNLTILVGEVNAPTMSAVLEFQQTYFKNIQHLKNQELPVGSLNVVYMSCRQTEQYIGEYIAPDYNYDGDYD